ncbi:SCP2 sterol-binding domain-containing protein [Lentzea sp. NPDC006480]|uniref:SCP2 sterol-binding domain-containing protein n=1 Tax=Lentzea sp. NPDC006480 TaxID=3157176 RepID=UPI0033B7A304
MLSELLLHGTDLARALGRPWLITRAQAVACLRGLLPAVVLLTDQEIARRASGTYHLRLRGGDDWTLHVRDGAVRVEPGRPRRADVRISVDPAGFLLGSVGLVSRSRAWPVVRGRRPWLVLRFGRLFSRI